MDTCRNCKSLLPDKIKQWADYCDECYNKGIMFYYESKKKVIKT